MRRPRRILVTGVGGPAGRSLADQLGERGLEAVGVDMTAVELPEADVHLVPAAADPGFADALYAIADREQVDLVVPTVTEELAALAVERRSTSVPVVVAPALAVRVANDKWLTSRFLTAAGISVPRSALRSELGEARLVAERLGVPWLSKPRFGRGGRGVVLHEVAPEPAFAGLDDAAVLQEFIPGPEYAVNLFLARDPADDVAVVLEKTALAQGRVGNATAVRRAAAPDVAKLARAAARRVGLVGPVDVDLRRRANGTPVVLELNARFGAHSAHAPEVVNALIAERLRGSVAPARALQAA